MNRATPATTPHTIHDVISHSAALHPFPRSQIKNTHLANSTLAHTGASLDIYPERLSSGRIEGSCPEVWRPWLPTAPLTGKCKEHGGCSFGSDGHLHVASFNIQAPILLSCDDVAAVFEMRTSAAQRVRDVLQAGCVVESRQGGPTSTEAFLRTTREWDYSTVRPLSSSLPFETARWNMGLCVFKDHVAVGSAIAK